MRSILIVILLGCAFTPLTAQLWKLAYTETGAALDMLVESSMKRAKVQGMSAALVDSAGIVWQGHYGYRDREAQKPASSRTIYRFASITKLFTGIAVMQLHEQGWLHIDSAVNRYIPEFSPSGGDELNNPVTIRSLLTHHSGLPSENWGNVFVSETFSADSVISYFNNHPVCNQPNKVDAYSNIGYSLLGALVERVSGMPYGHYIKENICMPLGMTNSGFQLSEEQKPFFSKQYLMNKKAFVEPPLGIVPAGGLYSTIEDMVKFAQMVLRKGSLGKEMILKPQTFDLMMQVQNKDVWLDYDKKMGLSWHIDADASWEDFGGSISHDGSTRCFHSSLVVLPCQGLATVVVANSETALIPVYITGRQMMVNALKLKGVNMNFPAPEQSVSRRKIYIAPHELDKFSGVYSSGDQINKLSCRNGKLRFQISPFDFILKPRADSTFEPYQKSLFLFKIPNPNLHSIRFDVIEQDTVLLIKSWGKEFLFASKAPQVPPKLLQNWEVKTGVYKRKRENIVLNTAKLEIHKGHVCMKASFGKSWLEMIVNPLDKNNGRINGLGRGTGDAVVFRREKGEEVLYYAGVKFYKTD